MKRGFSLVEVVVALTLLSAGLLAVASTAFMATRLQIKAQQQERATQLASSLADSLIAFRVTGSGASNVQGIDLAWTATQLEVAVTALTPGALPFTLRVSR